MLFSIITVCYNAEKNIKKTIESVLSQTFCDYEYIIVDGMSSDNTMSIINNYKSSYRNIISVSEPDSGIYDAMNKGVKLSSGDYVYFLNAGDVFCSDKILESISAELSDDFSIYYGNRKVDGEIQRYPKRITKFYTVYLEKMICHQSIIARKALLENYPFDLRFKICADRDWLIHCINTGAKTKYLCDIEICDYDMNGVSSVLKDFRADSNLIAKKYGGNLAVTFVKFKRFVGKILHMIFH